MSRQVTQAERITALETEVSYMREEQREMCKKIDELLALRNKGAGVFWLASLLFGTSIAGLIMTVIHYIKA